MMRAPVAPRTEITIGRGTVALRRDELDRLLRALGELRSPDAASVADGRVAGGDPRG